MSITSGVGPAVATDSGTTAVATLNGTTAGRSLVAILHWHGTGALVSVSVSGESNMTLLTTRSGISTNHCFAYLSTMTAGGNKTITATWDTALSGSAELWVKEYAGGNTSSWFDVEATNSGTGTSAVSPITTSVDNELILAVTTADVDEAGWSPVSGYTRYTLLNPWVWDDAVENLNVGVAGTKNPGFTIPSGNFMTTTAAFKPFVPSTAYTVRNKIVYATK